MIELLNRDRSDAPPVFFIHRFDFFPDIWEHHAVNSADMHVMPETFPADWLRFEAGLFSHSIEIEPDEDGSRVGISILNDNPSDVLEPKKMDKRHLFRVDTFLCHVRCSDP